MAKPPPLIAAAATSPCTQAIIQAEHDEALPQGLLYAIALTESGRRQPDGTVAPWPWTLNADGRGLYADSQQEAVTLARRLQSQGVRNIDLGCLQISSRYHPRAFASLDQAFTPGPNARYAAGLLRRLYQSLGSWESAVAAYHSGDPQRGEAYRQRVYAAYGGDLRPALAQAEQRERLQGPILAATRLIHQDPIAAINAFSVILERSPDDALALAGRALALQQSGDASSAYGDLVRLYSQTPNDRQVWQKLSQALSSQPAPQRIANLETLSTQHPEDRRIHDWIARDALAMGDDPRALTHKLAMIDLSPTEPRLYLDAAAIAERRKRPVDALSLCEAALTIPKPHQTPSLTETLTACTHRLRLALAQNPEGLGR
jgi:Flp pilus assembly protein TadD